MPLTTTTWRISPVAWVPIGIAIVAESVSNALRAYGLGTHLDRFTVTYEDYAISLAGAVLVLAAVAVSLSQARAAWVALTPGVARQRIVAGFAAVLLLAISVTAMASHILEAQRAKVADESGERGQYDRTLEAYGKAAAELDRLAGVRTIADVRAAMDAAPVSRSVFRRTKECTDVTRDDSFADCKPILDLRQEMAKAIRKHELAPEVARLTDELSKLKRPERAQETEAMVAGYWAWIMGLGVVFVATFGSVIFARVSRGSAAERSPNRQDREQTSYPPANDAELPNPQWFGADKPNGSPNNGGGPRVRRFTKDEAAADLVTRLALGERFASQDELKERYGVAKSTMSDWLREFEQQGLIPNRRTVGRCKQLTKA